MYQHISADTGTAYAVDGHIVVIQHGEGAVFCTCGASFDCEHRRKAEEARRESAPLNGNRPFSLMR